MGFSQRDATNAEVRARGRELTHQATLALVVPRSREPGDRGQRVAHVYGDLRAAFDRLLGPSTSSFPRPPRARARCGDLVEPRDQVRGIDAASGVVITSACGGSCRCEERVDRVLVRLQRELSLERAPQSGEGAVFASIATMRGSRGELAGSGIS